MKLDVVKLTLFLVVWNWKWCCLGLVVDSCADCEPHHLCHPYSSLQFDCTCPPNTAGFPKCTMINPCQEGENSCGSWPNVCQLLKPGNYVCRCSPNYYTVPNHQACIRCRDCSLGQFAQKACAEYEDRVCVDCSPGTFGELDATVCTDCRVGTYSNTSRATACTQCEGGAVATEEGSSSCTQCTAGTYPSSNQSECLECEAGTYSPTAGAPSCLPCGDCKWSDLGATACYQCPVGYRCVDEEKIMCGVGQYSGLGWTSCSQCTKGRTHNLNHSSCKICGTGTYSTDGKLCLPCPSGATTVDSPNALDHDQLSDCYCTEAGTYLSEKSGECIDGSRVFLTTDKYNGAWYSSSFCDDYAHTHGLRAELKFVPLIYPTDNYVNYLAENIFNMNDEQVAVKGYIENPGGYSDWWSPSFPLTDAEGTPITELTSEGQFWTGYGGFNQITCNNFSSDSHRSSGQVGDFTKTGLQGLSFEDHACYHDYLVMCVEVEDTRRG
eukprot:GCRY01002707.1.p1 GENE.GCRY01002707.1~~GCRY01002707.1.p1  ORF type:complete len:494 (+),score=47.41 GCRY01002707.1:159-1640(+)